jgi:hypothetical protein
LAISVIFSVTNVNPLVAQRQSVNFAGVKYQGVDIIGFQNRNKLISNSCMKITLLSSLFKYFNIQKKGISNDFVVDFTIKCCAKMFLKIISECNKKF